MVTETSAAYEETEWFDLGGIVRFLWQSRWWIIVTALLFGAAFAGYAFTAPPVYQASTVLVPSGSERSGLSSALSSALGSLGGLASLAGMSVPTGSGSTEEALAVLRSRQFTEDFIRANEIIPELFPKDWDAARRAWKSPGKQPTMAKAIKLFNATRGIVQDRKTGLVTVQVQSRDPAKAAAWANDMVRRLNAEMRARSIAKANASLQFLQQELAATSVVDTRAAINRLIEAQINQRMISSVSEEYAFRVVDRAMPPDRTEMVGPRRVVITCSGLLIGGILGCVLAFVRAQRRA